MGVVVHDGVGGPEPGAGDARGAPLAGGFEEVERAGEVLRVGALLAEQALGVERDGIAPSARAPESAGEAKTNADLSTDPSGLGAVYPNPSEGTATAPIILAEAAHVRIAVYDVLGREVAIVAEGDVEAGRHEIPLAGRSWAPGVYLVQARVTTEGGAAQTHVRRFTLVRR